MWRRRRMIHKDGRFRMSFSEEQSELVRRQREQASSTRRTTVPALEAVLYAPFPVLDHGFVRVIDYMGDDSAIVQAARVSYGAGTRSLRDDVALIRYLMKNRHSPPFEMCEIKIHVKLPIFVARQWIRHRTASVNEQSARYSVLSDEFYVPNRGRVQGQSETNRQGSGPSLPADAADEVIDILSGDAEDVYGHYLQLLEGTTNQASGSRPGVSRELARIGLPLSIYTEWYWKIDLRNLFHFLSLRLDEHAQFENQSLRSGPFRNHEQMGAISGSSLQGVRVGRPSSWSSGSGGSS